MKTLLTEREAAAVLGCSIHKMQKDRRTGSPIPYKKIGRSVRYDPCDLQAYLQQQTFTSTSAYSDVPAHGGVHSLAILKRQDCLGGKNDLC
ncbi:MAG: DNA-binding protein [Micavibrio sp.]|nr:DNA-binding protein [Micavibrio sp.]